MFTVTVSSKGRIVLPVALRRRVGLDIGSRLEVFEEPDGLKLRIDRTVPAIADPCALAGTVTAAVRGEPRHLLDFDAASLLARQPDRKKR